MAYVFSAPNLGMPAIAATVLTAQTTAPRPWKHGDIQRAVDPTYGAGEFIYLKGVASTVVGSWVTYNLDDFSTALLAAGASNPAAVAMSANVASQSGWYQISGKAVAKAAAAFADNGVVYATATAGTIDDAVVAGDRIIGALGASAVDTPSTGLAEFEISRPRMEMAIGGAALTEASGAIGGSNDGDIPSLTATAATLTGTLTGTANGSLADIAATASAVVGGATPTAAQVDTGIALAVSTIVSGTNEQLKELQTQVNALIADNVALRAAAREVAAKINTVNA